MLFKVGKYNSEEAHQLFEKNLAPKKSGRSNVRHLEIKTYLIVAKFSTLFSSCHYNGLIVLTKREDLACTN